MPAESRTPVDHAVINVLTRMDEAVALFRDLGFAVGERGYHSLGSINHLMTFPRDYLELVGIEPDATVVRREVAESPLGLNGLVFKTADADACHRDLTERGIPCEPPLAFSRPVRVGGQEHQAKFRTVRLKPGVVPAGRVYFCEHLTPELVWQPDLPAHANGAVGLSEFVFVTGDPARDAALYEKMLSVSAQSVSADESAVALDGFTIRFISAQRHAQRFGAGNLDPGGRDNFMAALVIRTSDIASARECLAACRGTRRVEAERSAARVTVQASEAFGCVIEFVE
jgi:hypothetical protein